LAIGHWSLVIGILLLPGYLTLHLPLWGKTNDAKTTLGQRLFLSLLISVLVSGLIGLVLAQAGVFSLGSLLLALAAYSVLCLAFTAAKGGGLSLCPPSIRLGWEDAIIIFLLCLSLLLYARPAEYILGWLDAGWYVNTGVHIAKTGSLSGENRIFSSLPPSARPLFYSSFASLKERFPYFPDTESRGIYLWAFAVADPDRGELTAYHPPLFSVWIAIFHALGELRFSLYATPFFGTLSVLGLYFAGKAMFGRKIGLLAAGLLAISFTQIYFSRMPYSEVLSQCLLFSGIYTLTTYVVEHEPKRKLYAAIAALSFGQAILSRIEGLFVILPLVMFFGCWIILRRSLPKDFRFFAIPFGLVLMDGVVLALTASRPYVELNSYGLWFKLRSLLIESPALLVVSAVSLGGLLFLIVLLGFLRSLGARQESRLNPIYGGRHLISTLLSLAILGLATYAYFISKGGPISQLGQFISPLGFWLGIFGLVELIRRDVNEKTAFFLALILIHGLATMSVLAISTTLSYVYPIRRQVPIVIPSLILLASYAILIWDKGSILSPPKGGKLLRVAQLIAIGILVTSFLALDMPYVNYRETPNAIAFSEKLANHFGQQDVVVFEDMLWVQDSRVGRFAAPLWSIYDKDTLLISTISAEEDAFSTAVAQWLDDGRRVYFVSQSDLPPLSLKEYEVVPIAEERWRSSTITTILAFPPRPWEFEIPFYIYQIAEGESL
jgi:4-amino-4-deoxy-L-arabinose transferase-like glycosyltransferase